MTIAILGTPAYASVTSYTANNVTLSVTVPAGTELLVIKAAVRDYNWGSFTGITFNGSATGVVLQVTPAFLAAQSCRIWTLTSPPAGTYNIVFAFNTSSGNGGAYFAECWAGGVDTTTPVSATNSLASTSSTGGASIAITVASGGVATGITAVDSVQPTAAAGQTVTGVEAIGGVIAWSSSYKANATAYATTYAGTPQSAQAVIAIKPAPVADTTVPTMTGGMTSSGVTATGFTLDWSATSRADNVAVVGFETSPDNATWTGRGNVLSFPFTGLIQNTAYTTYVRAFDAAGNKSTPSLSLTVTTATTADTTPPTFAGTLTSNTITSSSAVVDWSGCAKSDNVAITGYESSINNGTTWATVGTGTSATIGNLTSNSVNGILVRAFDAAGNRSTPALTINVTTPAAADTTPPVQSGAITSGVITPTSIAFSYPAASDNVGVVGYEISKDSGITWVVNGSGLTGSFNLLNPNTAYAVRVRAFDSAGNRSTPALAATITTASLAVGSFTSRPLSNDTNGLIFANVAGWTVFIHNVSTGALVTTKTGLSTNASGVLTYSDTSCVSGTMYRHIYVSSTGDEGMQNLVAA